MTSERPQKAFANEGVLTAPAARTSYRKGTDAPSDPTPDPLFSEVMVRTYRPVTVGVKLRSRFRSNRSPSKSPSRRPRSWCYQPAE